MDGVFFTQLKRISTPLGDVMHALKSYERGYAGFGEAYFTMVHHQAVKGWKRHKEMVLNLIVPVGSVRFVIYNERVGEGLKKFGSFVLSPADESSYGRLTISPGLWVAFEGLSRQQNLILNIANIKHDPAEAESLPLEAIKWNWSKASRPGVA